MLNQPQTSHKQITTTAINTPVSKMIPTIPSSASIFTQSYGGPLTLPLPLNPYSAMLCSWSSAWSSLQEAQHKILQHGGVPEGLQANGQSNKGDNSHQGECYVMICGLKNCPADQRQLVEIEISLFWHIWGMEAKSSRFLIRKLWMGQLHTELVNSKVGSNTSFLLGTVLRECW